MADVDWVTSLEAGLDEHIAVAAATRDHLGEPFARLVEACLGALQRGGKLLFFGNGGSAADAQHLAAEFTVRFEAERPALAALALGADSAGLSAAGNDYGFEAVFARQIAAHGRLGDLAIALSTSGRSPNVLRALETARDRGLGVAGLSGRDGGELVGLADPLLIVPADSTSRIQEMHITIGHLLCGAVEHELGHCRNH